MAGLEPARASLPEGFSYHLQLSLLLSDLWSGLYLHHFTGALRQVSTRSLFRASLGITILQVSPNLKSSTSEVSLRALKLSKSLVSTYFTTSALMSGWQDLNLRVSCSQNRRITNFPTPRCFQNVKEPFELVPPTGIKPVTYALEVRCSIQLSYGGKWSGRVKPPHHLRAGSPASFSQLFFRSLSGGVEPPHHL
jgi:hypothetical protein